MLGIPLPGALDLTAVIRAKEAALASAARITSELPNMLDPLDRNELALERDRAEALAEDMEQVRIDLTAAGTVIPLLPATQVDDLRRLETELDPAIIRSRLLNLTLSTVAGVLDSVARVRDIVGPRVPV